MELIEKKKRGFAVMCPERQREIASQGGKKAHELGKAHEFTSAEAKASGSIGGKIVSARPGHMARIGSLGGRARRERREREATDKLLEKASVE